MTGFIFGGGAGTTVTATGGSVARSLSDRAADERNVLDFGADPTNTNDNATAFEAAFGSGGAVYVPAGTYKFTRGINLDALGGNGSWTMRGAGDATFLTASMDDFIVCKVTRNTGGVSSCRSISDMKIINSKQTLASPVTNISGISWGTIVGGVLAGQTGVTVTATAHGFTVGSSRLLNVAGIVSTGLNCNGLVGCYFNDANHFQYHFDTGDPGSYTSGGTYAPRGGAVSTIGYYGGALYNVNMDGFYAYYAELDSTVHLFNCAGVGGGNVSGTVGFWMGGESGCWGCDVTGYDTGVKTAASGAAGFVYDGGRIEANTTAMHLGGASGAKIDGTTFEYNLDGIVLSGSGWVTISAVQIHGSTGGRGTSQSAIHYVSGNHITVEESTIYGVYSTSGIYFESGIGTAQGLRFRNVRLSNTGGSLLNTTITAGTVCPQWDSCLNMNGSAFSSTFANRPSNSCAFKGEIWQFTDCPGTTTASCTAGTITGNTTFTVAGTVTGTYQVGDTIAGTNVTAGTTITGLGTGAGGAGTYTCTSSTNATSTTITGTRILPNVAISGGGANNVYGMFDGTSAWYVLCRAG